MAKQQTQALAKTEPPITTLARPEESGISVEQLVARVEKIQAVSERVMKEGRHFGKVPGVDKPSLLKPGAEILCMTFQLAPSFTFQETRTGDHLEVVATCTLTHIPSGAVVGSAVGSCTSREAKYAYRKGERTCPKCKKSAIIKGQEQYGGGWLCWKKKDGCGAKFEDGDAAIESQKAGRVENPDLPDTHNTVRKMASKRALVAVVLIVTCASDMFTQDVEEHGAAADPGDGSEPAAKGPPVVAVATSEDVENVLTMLGECRSPAELESVSRANKNRKWSKSQREKLQAAYAQREAALKNPEDDGGNPDGADAADGDPAEDGAA